MATTNADPMRHCREAAVHITKLAYLFPLHADGTSARTQCFVDEDFRRIKEVLREFDYMTWSVIPRTYAILRLVRRIEDMDDFLAQNLSDLSIPYTNDNLPINLSLSTKESFLRVQHLVLTSAMDLERGEAGEHKHITSHEELQFDVVGELGRGGGCTQVQKVWSNIGRALYAVKFIRRGDYFQGDRNALRDFEGELQSAKKVLHHHVVKIVGSFTEEKYVGIIMKTVGEMNLGQLLKGPINADTKSSLRTYFGCLASGLFAIHQVGIKHKDVKPENIVIRKSIAYFTDFGLALDFSTTEENRSTTMGKPAVKYTALYSAPEWWAWSARNTLSDIWSLGAVYLEMATVLYGETVYKLWDFLANHGTHNTISYSRNLSGVHEWIRFLRSKPGHETDTVTLDIVEATMKEAKEKRPKGYQLWKMIENQAPRDVSFACRACVESFNPSERPTQQPLPREPVDVAPEFSRLEPVGPGQEIVFPEIHEIRHSIPLLESVPNETGLIRNDTVISRQPFPMVVFLENKWEGAVAEYCNDDLSFISNRTIRRHKLNLADGNVLLTWVHDGLSRRTRFFPNEHLGTDFHLGLKCLDETFNIEDAKRVFKSRQLNMVGSAPVPTSSTPDRLHTTKEGKDVPTDQNLDPASGQKLVKAVGQSPKTSTTELPTHAKALKGVEKLEDQEITAKVSKNPEESSKSSEKEKSHGTTKSKSLATREEKLQDLKKFASSFKLTTNVPTGLVSILSNDKQKQKEIIQKQNDIVKKETELKKVVSKDQPSDADAQLKATGLKKVVSKGQPSVTQQRVSSPEESPSALPAPQPYIAQPQVVNGSYSNESTAVSPYLRPYVSYYAQSPYSGLNNNSTQQAGASVMPRIIMQLEFYFSTDNLVKDFNLRKNMDSQGFVFLFFIASLDRIQTLHASIDALRSMCIRSDVIEIVKGDDQIERVRRKHDWEHWVLEKATRFPHARHDGPETHAEVLSPPTPQYGIPPPHGYRGPQMTYSQSYLPPGGVFGGPTFSSTPQYRPMSVSPYPQMYPPILSSQAPMRPYYSSMYSSNYPQFQSLGVGRAHPVSMNEASINSSPNNLPEPFNERPQTFYIPQGKSNPGAVRPSNSSQAGQVEKPRVRFASEPSTAPPKALTSTQQNPSGSMSRLSSSLQAASASRNRLTPSTLAKSPRPNNPNQHFELASAVLHIAENPKKIEAVAKSKGDISPKPTKQRFHSLQVAKYNELVSLGQHDTKHLSQPSRTLWSQVAAIPTTESSGRRPIELDLDTGHSWSLEEDALLCIAYSETVPTNWKTIAAMVGTRSQGQCKTRCKNLDQTMSPELRAKLSIMVKEIRQWRGNDDLSD